MPDYDYPGVYIEETASGPPPIAGVPTSIAAFVDCFTRGPMHRPVQVFNTTEFKHQFGGLYANGEAGLALQLFFQNGGSRAYVVRVPSGPDGIGPDAAAILGRESASTGIYALNEVDIFNLLCIPALGRLTGEEWEEVYRQAMNYCERKRAFFLVDTPAGTDTPETIAAWVEKKEHLLRHQNAALYFPRIAVADPLNKHKTRDIGAAGAVAGLYARTDSQQGVWVSPAGVGAALHQVSGLGYPVGDQENGMLNARGINCLRSFPAYGIVSWGARTLLGSDALASEWKYVAVRRLALYIEESLYRGLAWAIFGLGGEPLWSRIRQSAGNFLQGLFRQGAFQGTTPDRAYFVRCDRDTNTQYDIENGQINLIVGFAPLRPAEFVVVQILLSM